MANAYRDYLSEDLKAISKLTDTKEDIPLFIESFGKTEDEDTFLSIPITVDVALTSFDDMKKMVSTLNKNNITNINFRLTGFTNGGMVPTVPTKVDFEKVVGGDSGFTDFLSYASKKGVGVYPEFDFAYMQDTAWFDGFTYDDDAVKTIDDRYITKREYDAVLQTFATTGKICISPSVYSDYFEDFHDSFKDVLGKKKTNVSLSTLGSDLNSDFDEDEPYNREDSKAFTVEMLRQFTSNKTYNKIMVDAGNSYAIPYADVVLNAPLDSSRYLNTSESVPFFGIVYHGYLVFAGKPTNMAGDMQYEKLKIIENGATLYMMLSYDNVEILKEDPYLSKYYAISFEHWQSTLFSQYNKEDGSLISKGIYDELNEALGDVQTSTITYHAYIDCMREFSAAEEANIAAIATANWKANADKLLAKWNKAEVNVNLYNRITDEFNAKLVDLGIEAALESYGYAELIPQLAGLSYVATVNKVVSYLESQVTTLNNSKAAAQQVIDAKQAEIDNPTPETDVAALQAEIDTKNAEIASIDAKLNALPAQIEEIKAKKDQATANDKIVDDKLIRLNAYFPEGTTLASLEAARNEAQAEYVAYSSDATKQAEIDLLKKDYDSNRVINDGSVVYVEYTSDTGVIKYFVINYNDYDVKVENVVINGHVVNATVKPNSYESFYIQPTV